MSVVRWTQWLCVICLPVLVACAPVVNIDYDPAKTPPQAVNYQIMKPAEVPDRISQLTVDRTVNAIHNAWLPLMSSAADAQTMELRFHYRIDTKTASQGTSHFEWFAYGPHAAIHTGTTTQYQVAVLVVELWDQQTLLWRGERQQRLPTNMDPLKRSAWVADWVDPIFDAYQTWWHGTE